MQTKVRSSGIRMLEYNPRRATFNGRQVLDKCMHAARKEIHAAGQVEKTNFQEKKSRVDMQGLRLRTMESHTHIFILGIY